MAALRNFISRSIGRKTQQQQLINMPKVLTVKCPPEVPSLKNSSSSLKRKRPTEEPSSSSSSRKKKDREKERDEFNAFFAEAKQLGESTLRGLAGIKVRDDVLTKLGVPPPKQQKMPFKMAIGIMNGRAKRMEKRLKRAKDSGQVVATSLLKKKEKKRDSESMDSGLDGNIKGGVLHINQKRYKQWKGSKKGEKKNR